ncbi:serine/threonine-protein phosphatase 4 regulatory subunit 1-like isoform X2 [Argiope bruennichi]|uniref:serine/threonine-protein phosphatase 4 regulatory subunit 1-like isoform X2 n=1 Tax=Argiope bruennichi TaxID=94029 RepID=UPI00249535B1|nr:serine/threonine-protein phosphatase 4 regulatory subunit 1-like isoform X2 [Argiope bruennichi]
MADVFSTEDYEDCLEENGDNKEVNEPVKDNSDMTLKQGVSEPELFAAEDLLVNPDDLLPPVVKLEKYASSDIVFNRQVVVRNLLETLRLVHENKDDVASVVNVLCSISEDYDFSVRTELMVHLPHIAAFCKEVKLYYIIDKYLVPMLISYLGDDSNMVRKSAHTALLSCMEQGLLDKEIVVEKVCPLVLHFTDSIHQEDLRTESIVLMSKLVSQMGKKETEELFLEPLFNLIQEQSNCIRKACASTFGDVCTAVGKETTEEILLPKFFQLCKDSAWCVRKACTENFMAVSCCVSKEMRNNELAPLYMNLLTDTSRWVRLTAYQALGAFISTFADPDRTGLYYSKDGILTVVDAASSILQSSTQESSTNSVNETLRNGQIKESNNLCSDDSSISLNRTNSSKCCDSIVPACSIGTNSAAVVPDIACHVGNNCSVIETAVTDSDEMQASGDSSSSNLHCDSKQLTENVYLGDSWTSESRNNVQNGENSHEVNNTTKYDDCLSQKLTDEEDEFKNLWSKAVLTCDEVINGAFNHTDINGDVKLRMDFDQEVVQHMKPDEKSALLSSIVDSSAALSGSVNCEAIPLIACSNSVRENGTLKNYGEFSTQHSICDHRMDCNDISSNSISTAQESNIISKDVTLDADSKESVELKVNNDNESAFNYFQYWREPLPEIDAEVATNCLNDNSEERVTCSRNSFFDLSYNQQKRGNWWSYLDDIGDSHLDLSSESSLAREMRITDDETSVNKGEPPPGARLSPTDQDIVPPELLVQYLCMTDGSNSATDTEIARHCAYSLPAVALTLGRQYWPCLKDTFDVLMNELPSFVMMWKVRRTVAFSMHQLAVILGPEITSRDLIPVFSRLISDLDEVRIGILQNLCEFLKVLRPEERKQFLPSLPKFLVSANDTESNFKNWRFRLILAEQLVLISDLFEPQEVRDHLVPLALTLIKDKICEVRLAAVRVMASAMKRLSEHLTPVYTKAVLSELTEKFVHSPKWLHRQLYVYICQQIILDKALSPDQFAEDALPQLLYLCWDRVPNVRIAIARCLVVVIWPLDVFSNPKSPHRELLLQTIHTLQSDMDADVRFYANMVSTHECSCLQNGEFNNVVEPFV